MGLSVPTRTHIVPMGYEEDRVDEAARRLKADRVVIIAHEGQSPKFNARYRNVTRKLDKLGIERNEKPIRCNIFSVYDSLGTINEAIDMCPEDEVYVNLATGSKVTAIAGMISCMVSGATPYYVQAMSYEGEYPEGIANIMELPEYPIDPPEPDQVSILDCLDDVDSATKGDLITFSEKHELDFISGYSGEDKARYRRLDRHVITPMINRGYVEVHKDGRYRKVSITQRGEYTLQAFRSLSYRSS